MGTDDSIRKLKGKKNTKKKREGNSEMGNSQLAEIDKDFFRASKKKKSKKSSDVIANKVEVKMLGLSRENKTSKINGGNKKLKKLRYNEKKTGKIAKTGIDESDMPDSNEVEDKTSGKKDVSNEAREDKSQKSRKKKRKNNESVKRAAVSNEEEDVSEQQNGKSEKVAKKKKKRQLPENELSLGNVLEKRGGAADYEVDQISSGDEDCSKGMKKWVLQYHQSRPGIKVLQDRIDDFIAAHEAREEKARKEREAQAAEGGWTVVVHHKGRKKTTDVESGIAVGSVAQAAVLDKMAKKKNKEVGVDFYQFQKREAHRNEIMMLQSKFEQDKKRIQQMRAARKFRPY